jgi:Family of unknown function (DUF5683)
LRPLVYNILLSFFVLTPLHSQQPRRYEQPIATPLRILSLPDSLIRIFNEDSIVAKSVFTSDTVLRRGKSTTVAMLASLVVPGAGQIYNEAYWKTPLIWGLGYYFVSIYRQQNTLYQQYRNEYSAAIDTIPATVILPLKVQQLKDNRDFYHSQRDTFGWYIAITYLINVLDAYVDASLYSFEVSPNLQPSNDLRATLRVRF